jgi:hypothetical protein
MSEQASGLYDWERCSHEGIGQPGCPTCDPNKDRCMARAVRADNKELRVKLAAAEKRVAELEMDINEGKAVAFGAAFENSSIQRKDVPLHQENARLREAIEWVLTQDHWAISGDIRAELRERSGL